MILDYKDDKRVYVGHTIFNMRPSLNAFVEITGSKFTTIRVSIGGENVKKIECWNSAGALEVFEEIVRASEYTKEDNPDMFV